MKLETQIKKWQEAGVIGEREAQAILQYEERQPEKSYILYGIIAIGVTALICGLISIIAANWNAIPPNIKLINYVFLQCGLGYGYLKTSKEKGLLKSALLWLFSLNFFGGIGLIGQIYHLSSDAWKPLAFWVSLALLPTLLEERRLLIHTWMITVFITLQLFIASIRLNELYFCASAFMITAIGLNGFARFIKLPENFEKIALKYGVAVLLLSASFTGNALWAQDINNTKRYDFYEVSWAVAAVFFAAFCSMISAYWRKPALDNPLRLRVGYLCGFICLYLTLPFYVPSSFLSMLSAKIMGAVGFIALWSLSAWIAATLNDKRLYNIFTLIIALRFIGIYFEVFGSLLETGFGLIISGVFILMIAFIWNRYREPLLKWAQK